MTCSEPNRKRTFAFGPPRSAVYLLETRPQAPVPPTLPGEKRKDKPGRGISTAQRTRFVFFGVNLQVEKTWTETRSNNGTTGQRLLVKDRGIERLARAHVLVVGLGGVGGFAAEFLARAGIGRLTLVDADTVSPTNLNRQIAALTSTLGQPKVEVIARRLSEINPSLHLELIERFLQPEQAYALPDAKYDYVADCIDSLSPKLELIRACMDKKIPLVSAMGAGGRLDPAAVRVADISKSHNCPLARSIRKRLSQLTGRKPRGFYAVYSEELPDETSMRTVEGEAFKRSYYGTISYMPALFGLHAAAHILRSLLREDTAE